MKTLMKTSMATSLVTLAEGSGIKYAFRALALALPLIVLQPCQATEPSKPIVDVRFDAPYRQIESSMGDEWAPTWGRDDVLYTGNDDGSSFGGMPQQNIAFGKLEGNDPYKLKGTSINRMGDFEEPVRLGPDGAMWNTLGSYKLNGVLYRFAPCGFKSSNSCLVTSSDQGKTWAGNAALDRPLFASPKFSAPFFIAFRQELEGLMGGKPGDYVYAAAYSGVITGADQYILARVPTEKLQRADMADWSFQQKDFLFKADLNGAEPVSNSMGLGPDGGNWKTMNTYSVDGALYMFVTRCFYPWGSNDPKRRHNFENSSIIKSTDYGRTWTRAGAENYAKPMFPGKRFGTPYFVWYGKDGAAGVDNADKYIYAVSNNGHFENGDDYVLGRVLRSQLPHLSAADWSFYRTGDGMQEASWTANLSQARPILAHPEQSSMTGMTYIEGLRRYVMVVWHYHRDNFEQGIKDKDLGTVLEFFEAPKPWGPWNKVKTFDSGHLGWYAPIIGQRFQTVENSSAVKGLLYATGLDVTLEGGQDLTLYKLNYLPITFSTKPLQHKDPAFVGAR
jgi:hypothetical protein